jgi:replicative superfamily II helicase
MAFKGLFIGIDRYASPGVNWLTCSSRDATALHALFTDTLGGTTKLLLDEEATVAAIREQFEVLATSDPDDVVVIAFSGHGTETHELATCETDIYDLATTAIPLTTLGDWCARIKARRLLIVLDCCFSGAMGAKALQVEGVPRDIQSVDAKLNQISGEGRVILTASGPTEQAWESPRLGHSFLTLHFLEALQGPEEVRQGDRVGVLRLLDYVVRRVVDTARIIRREQNPAVRGTIDVEFTWPVFAPGAIFRAAFPEYGNPVATADIASLASFGFPPAVIQAWAGEIPRLNQLQLDAINDYGILRGEHVVASAPTSSGKTMLGELAAVRGALDRRRALFLMPLKALVNDKLRQFHRVYGPFGIRTIEATGETDDITPLLRGQYDIALLTYEKFSAIALTNPHVLEQVGTIVIDEVQMIADAGRGANLEFILTLLRMRRRDGLEPQLIALSAVIGDTNGLERWLNGRLLRRVERPVPLDEGIICYDGRFRYLDGDTGESRSTDRFIRPLHGEGKHRDWVIPLVQRLVNEGKQVIIFRETTGETRHGAQYMAEALRLPPAAEALQDLPAGDPSQASAHLRQVLAHGVAFHNSHLDREERRVIEEHFRRRDTRLRVIVATTTLAMGVNTPASAVVIVGLEHPGSQGRPPQPYSVAEYKNLVGRAGRLGYAERGASYLIATSAREEHEYWVRYVSARPENLASRFLAADPRTLIIRVLVAAGRVPGGVSGDEIIDFLEASFGVFQMQQAGNTAGWDRRRLQQALDELARHSLVERDEQGRFHITALGRLAGESAVEVETLLRAIACLRALRAEEVTDPALIAIAQTSVELDAIYLPVNRISKHKEPQHWMGQLRAQGLSETVLANLQRNITAPGQDTVRAKKAVACLYYVSGMGMEEIERAMSQFGGAFDGVSGPIRSVTSRTCDVLPMIARAAQLLHAGVDLEQRVARLLFRLDLGIQGPVVDLARYAERTLDRADYRRLCDARMTEREALAGAEDRALLPLLGNDARKIIALRSAVERWRSARPPAAPAAALPAYQQ